MIQYSNKYLVQKNNSFFVLVIFSIVLLYPVVSSRGFFMYVPQLVMGFLAIYSILKIKMVKPAISFLFFAIYMIVISSFLSIVTGYGNVFNIFISQMRLFYPFLAIVVGGLLKKKIKIKFLLYVLFFFLIIEFLFIVFQFNSNEFRIWSYTLYRQEGTVESYLNNFAYSTGKRAIGTFGNPNTLGLTVIIFYSSIIIFAGFLKNIISRKILCILSTLATIFIVINTQSRTAILLFIFTIILMFYWTFEKRKKNIFFKLFISVICIIFILLFIQSKISRDITFSALDSRIYFWETRISQMYNYVMYEKFFASVLGIGFNKAREFGFYDNIYIKIFVSGGFIGIMIFLKTIIDMILAVSKVREEKLKQLGLILTFLWIIGSGVMDFQEIFKLSTITFILLGYVLYPGVLSKTKK